VIASSTKNSVNKDQDIRTTVLANERLVALRLSGIALVGICGGIDMSLNAGFNFNPAKLMEGYQLIIINMINHLHKLLFILKPDIPL
jgi:hypothetical protein